MTLPGKKIFISTTPFGAVDPRPIEMLDASGAEYLINPAERKLREEELAGMITDFDALIAGTERITSAVMDGAPRLRMISRVGIGLDGVDLLAARERGIEVAYTPDAPSPAVAELTVGLMLSLLRGVKQADEALRRGEWTRIMGRRLGEVTVGVLGAGRIGKRVIRHLSTFGSKVLANDIEPDREFGSKYGVKWAEKERIYREADVVTLHLPLTPATINLIGREEISQMKPGALLVNTARGELIVEEDLVRALGAGPLGGAAIDVFREEPYTGALTSAENCLLTCHMGSMSEDCRARMEIEATENALCFLRGEPVPIPVPEFEYGLRARM